MREREQTTVVGASVAGLYAAYRLAAAGHPVRVYEAQHDFSPDARTLIVTPAWLDLLDFDPQEAVLNRTRVFELISPSASVRIPLSEPDVILERAAFLRLLTRRVRELGGQVTLGHRFTGLEENGASQATSPLLRFRNGRGEELLPAATVMGADGAHSAVARAAGVDGLERVAIRQARVALPADQPADTVRVWFDTSSTRFFFWLIPESARVGAAGLIADTPHQAERALERFLAAHGLEPLAQRAGYQAAWVPLHSLGTRAEISVDGGRVLLMGDAAGQVKVTTVGGMVTGMRGAAAAARALLRGTAYSAELRPLRQELNAHALVRHVLDGFRDEDYDRLLRSLNEGAAGVLARYHRDQLTQVLWRVVVTQPRWLSLGARALVRSVVSGRDL
jgi:flavin-dependent dehydrogenase